MHCSNLRPYTLFSSVLAMLEKKITRSHSVTELDSCFVLSFYNDLIASASQSLPFPPAKGGIPRLVFKELYYTCDILYIHLQKDLEISKEEFNDLFHVSENRSISVSVYSVCSF